MVRIIERQDGSFAVVKELDHGTHVVIGEHHLCLEAVKIALRAGLSFGIVPLPEHEREAVLVGE